MLYVAVASAKREQSSMQYSAYLPLSLLRNFVGVALLSIATLTIFSFLPINTVKEDAEERKKKD
jgi:small-conductance mechanosensitive channel